MVESVFWMFESMFYVIWELTKIVLYVLRALLNEIVLNDSWKCFYFGFGYFWKLLKELDGLIWWVMLLKLLFETTYFVSNVFECFDGGYPNMPILCFGDCMLFCCSQILELIVYDLAKAYLWEDTFLWLGIPWNEDSCVCCTHMASHLK